MDKLSQLKQVVEIINTDRASKKEVALIIGQLVDVLKKVRGDLKKDFDQTLDLALESNGVIIEDAIKELEIKLGSALKEITSTVSKARKETLDEAYKSINREVYNLEQAIKNIPQFDTAQLENKWSLVISNLENRLNSIKLPELSPIEIRDSLESLTDEQRLDWTAVNGVVGIHVGIKPPEDKKMLWVDTR
jgi:hypothetical protein